MKINQISKKLYIFENRDSSLTYNEKKVKGIVDRVTVELEGVKSATATKLAKRFKELKTLKEQIDKETEELKTQAREHALGLFDAADEIYTRVVETCSLTITVSKQITKTIPAIPDSETSEFDFEGFYKDLSVLVPELIGKMEDLKKLYTKVTKIPGKPEQVVPADKNPSIRVDLNETSMMDKFSEWVSKVYIWITNWCIDYDQKLLNLKNKYQII